MKYVKEEASWNDYQRDERATVARVLLGQVCADVAEVEVFQSQKKNGQPDAGQEKKEGR